MFSHLEFAHSPVFNGPLIPPPDQWPVFDTVLMCSFSPETSPSPPTEKDAFPSSADLAAMPIPPSRASPRNKDPNHIPRPRNAFMLFRSAFAAAQKISSTIEHDNRHITRIIAHCWNRLSEQEKQVWRDKAATEKREHAKRYPNYRFSPTGRGNRRVKRKVRRNGAEDVKRCEKLAELVMAGKLGQELEIAIKKIDDERLTAAHIVVDKPGAGSSSADTPIERDDIPPFRSPLLPPTRASEQVPEMSEPEVCATTALLVEPPTFSPLTGSDNGLDHLLGSSTYQYFQTSMHNDEPCPGSVLPPFDPLDHFQSAMNFVQNRYSELQQSAPDFSLFSCDRPDNFPYYP